ncbi:ABC transporter permease [Streptomyces sannanensis]|uniref:Transport permease protein n=1 Tax=Streptomyces sannanensis TaxID=285536 RepID=A0ABP6SCK0_9ACTN
MTALARMTALGRAELTLLGRNRTALFTALALPALMTFSFSTAVREMDLEAAGLTAATVLLPGSIVLVLLFAVYSTLTGAYVARREELVLKRLRTGELSDLEILAGTALPAVVTGLAQCVLLAVGGALALDAPAPASPLLMIAGVVLGMTLVVALAAASSGLTRTSETAQLTVLPLVLVSALGSGVVAPLELFPDRLASALELLPMSPVVALIRDGWTGGADAGESLKHLAVGLAWALITVFAVRRWFRWEPRR